jgi:hypothetical protein
MGCKACPGESLPGERGWITMKTALALNRLGYLPSMSFLRPHLRKGENDPVIYDATIATEIKRDIPVAMATEVSKVAQSKEEETLTDALEYFRQQPVPTKIARGFWPFKKK